MSNRWNPGVPGADAYATSKLSSAVNRGRNVFPSHKRSFEWL
jgi:hypothetical protein